MGMPASTHMNVCQNVGVHFCIFIRDPSSNDVKGRLSVSIRRDSEPGESRQIPRLRDTHDTETMWYLTSEPPSLLVQR